MLWRQMMNSSDITEFARLKLKIILMFRIKILSVVLSEFNSYCGDSVFLYNRISIVPLI